MKKKRVIDIWDENRPIGKPTCQFEVTFHFKNRLIKNRLIKSVLGHFGIFDAWFSKNKSVKKKKPKLVSFIKYRFKSVETDFIFLKTDFIFLITDFTFFKTDLISFHFSETDSVFFENRLIVFEKWPRFHESDSSRFFR